MKFDLQHAINMVKEELDQLEKRKTKLQENLKKLENTKPFNCKGVANKILKYASIFPTFRTIDLVNNLKLYPSAAGVAVMRLTKASKLIKVNRGEYMINPENQG